MSLPLIITGLLSATAGAGVGAGVGYMLCDRARPDTLPVVFNEDFGDSNISENGAEEGPNDEPVVVLREKLLIRKVNNAMSTYMQHPTKEHALDLWRLASKCNVEFNGKCQYIIDKLFDDFQFSVKEVLSRIQ